MNERDVDRLGAAAGIVASASVGVPMLLATLGGEGPGALWWVAYLLHLGAFLLTNRSPDDRPRWLGDRPLLAVMVAAGSLAFAIAPALGFIAVLLVITTAIAAFVVPIRVTIAILVGQTALIAVATARVTDSPDIVILTTLVYAAFQAFAVALVSSRQREAVARSELEVVNAELRAANALLDASSRSAERVRIARDLHDLVGHQLTALALELEVATHQPAAPADEHVRRARSIAKQLLASVREAVGDLRVRRIELRDALAAAVAGLPRPHVHLDVDEHLEVDDDTAIALVRCVQEIVTNALRHADASNLTIVIDRRADGRIHLEATDDGRGTHTVEPGNGLTGMRERIETLDGAIRFSTDPGRGFRIDAEVPAT
jgi:signal transduction histidine kinase